uniref:Uncharacterized protein n=1 Tax=Lotharella oceanica TaxID=641309 RepID=A0A7S2XF67_9EUKA|mmetsp:Transcript_36531/g.67507  ORF Transcript_36531/g.67507 Transcript_36531/m.67507 type:complete len:117 (+) Transcript_36531:75-425(+)
MATKQESSKVEDRSSANEELPSFGPSLSLVPKRSQISTWMKCSPPLRSIRKAAGYSRSSSTNSTENLFLKHDSSHFESKKERSENVKEEGLWNYDLKELDTDGTVSLRIRRSQCST